MVAPLIGQTIGEDQKKSSLPTNQWVFGLKTKKNAQMVSSQNGDTRGGPLPLSDATAKNSQTRINFISKTKLNSVLIRNDKV